MNRDMILFFGALAATIFAGIFAGSETGMYQLSKLRLRVGIERKQFLFLLLGESLSDSTGMLLALLAGTNVAQYIATGLVTYVLLGMVCREHVAEVITVLIMAPVFFLFSELIPKSLFFHRSNTVMPLVAPILVVCRKIFTWCGLVPMMKILANALADVTKLATPAGPAITAAFQPHIKAIIQDSQEEGLLSPVQANIINRLSTLSYLDVTSVMTPITKVQMVEVHSDKSVLLDKLHQSPFTRLLVYEHSAANILGYINIYDCLSSSEDFQDVTTFNKPIRKISANTSIIDAINIMRNENLRILMVAKSGLTGAERNVGILTMKDLIEELVGELAEW
jgi:putative hemolysin